VFIEIGFWKRLPKYEIRKELLGEGITCGIDFLELYYTFQKMKSRRGCLFMVKN